MDEAIRQTKGLEADWMLSSILADRYLNTAYRPTRDELASWLDRFGDRPEAGGIREQLQQRLTPASSTALSADAPTNAGATPADAGLVGERVRALFVRNRDKAAIAAAASLLVNANSVNRADGLFASGLAAWRLRRLETAGAFLTASYDSSVSPSARAAAAFWMSRVEEARTNRGERALWLRRAAQETDTFYGQLARRILNSAPPCLAGGGTMAEPDLDAVLATDSGRRALGLLQIGQKRHAEAELRVLWQDTWPDPDYRRALLLVAHEVGLTQLASDLQSDRLVNKSADRPSPIPRLRPDGGFVVDPSLVYALVQHESRFQTGLISRTGARGLMQIMPNTAKGIGALPASQTARLDDPAVNLAVGQRYLLALSDDKAVAGNLLKVLASYAQGVVGMKRWADTLNDSGDPLMFIEAIPNRNLTVFIQTILSNAWVYAVTMHLPLTSLDALRAGAYPHLVRRQSSADRGPGACPARNVD